MNRKKIIYGCVVAVLLGVILLVASFYVGGDRQQKQPEQQVPTAYVEITKNGFVPATLQVSSGTKVIWVNKDSAPHQVSSDPYPDHTTLPGLHAEKPLASEQTYSYTFSKTGTWTYHDYLNPSLSATVQVK